MGTFRNTSAGALAIALLALGLASTAQAKNSPPVIAATSAEGAYFVRQPYGSDDEPTKKGDARLFVQTVGGSAKQIARFSGWRVTDLEVAGQSPVLTLNRVSGERKRIKVKSRIVAVDPSTRAVRTIRSAALRWGGSGGRYCGSVVDIPGDPLGEKFIVRERRPFCKGSRATGLLRNATPSGLDGSVIPMAGETVWDSGQLDLRQGGLVGEFGLSDRTHIDLVDAAERHSELWSDIAPVFAASPSGSMLVQSFYQEEQGWGLDPPNDSVLALFPGGSVDQPVILKGGAWGSTARFCGERVLEAKASVPRKWAEGNSTESVPWLPNRDPEATPYETNFKATYRLTLRNVRGTPEKVIATRTPAGLIESMWCDASTLVVTARSGKNLSVRRYAL